MFLSLSAFFPTVVRSHYTQYVSFRRLQAADQTLGRGRKTRHRGRKHETWLRPWPPDVHRMRRGQGAFHAFRSGERQDPKSWLSISDCYCHIWQMFLRNRYCTWRFVYETSVISGNYLEFPATKSLFLFGSSFSSFCSFSVLFHFVFFCIMFFSSLEISTKKEKEWVSR